MRFLRIVGVVLGCAACSDSGAAGRAGEGKLVLELGGTHGSLRAALVKAGLEPAAPRSVRAAAHDPGADTPADPAASVDPPSTRPASSATGDPPSVQPPPKAPAAEPLPEPGYVVVTLGDRQTLIHLARKHLGDANRFREILALNGWSEADSRRLAAGQKVKIPRPAARSSRR